MAAMPMLRFNQNRLSGAFLAKLLLMPSIGASTCCTLVHKFAWRFLLMLATSTFICLAPPFLYVHFYADRIFSTSFLSFFSKKN
jgi:hypothetical protein